jgi:hypothetical protein
MVPNGMPLLAMLQHETLSSALAPGLFVGDPGRHRRDKDQWRINRRSLPIAAQSAFYGDVSEPNSRMRRRNFIATNRTPAPGPIGNYAWKIWHGAAPLHPLHTGSRDSVDRSGSHDCDG